MGRKYSVNSLIKRGAKAGSRGPRVRRSNIHLYGPGTAAKGSFGSSDVNHNNTSASGMSLADLIGQGVVAGQGGSGISLMDLIHAGVKAGGGKMGIGGHASPGNEFGKGKAGKSHGMSQQQQLFQQLTQIAGQLGAPTIDYEQALKDSAAQIRDAYAHDIAAIRSGSAAARKDTAQNRREVEQAYAGLAQSYMGQSHKAVKQGKGLAKAMRNSSEQAAHFLDHTSDQNLNQQASLAKGLGIEDAMPAASASQTKEAAQGVERLVHEGAHAANSQLGYTGNQARFLQRGGQNAKLEGTNQSSALLQDLQHFLQGQHQQIQGLKGQKHHELAANQSSVMSSVADMQQQAQQDQWSRLMDLAGLKMDMNQQRFQQHSDKADYRLKLMEQQQQALQDAQSNSGSSMPGAQNFADAQQYLQKLQHPGQGTQLFDNFLNSTQMTNGTFHSDSQHKDVPLTPYKAMQLVEQQARAQGLSEKDIQLLRLAVFAQMGNG